MNSINSIRAEAQKEKSKSDTADKVNSKLKQNWNWDISFFIKRNHLLKSIFSGLKSKNNKSILKQLKEHNIDILLYLRPQQDFVKDFPFISVHWDVGHRSTFPFPEMTMNGNYEHREYYYTQINQALMILCESQAGARELCQYYQFFKDKIKVMPLFAGEVINKNISEQDQASTLLKYGLQKEKFFFYPAQFWAMKNHHNLIMAFREFIDNNKDKTVKLVLCGSDKGNLSYIKKTVEALKLNDAILFPGFVPDNDLNVFYKNAIALVFPSFLGPTNMPLIEAAHLKCPVLCSNLEGHAEIMGSNALYFKPTDVQGIKNALNEIMDFNRRKSIVEGAHNYNSSSHFNLSYSLSILNEVLLEVKPVRETWE